MDWPKTEMVPAAGLCRPTIERIKTDLPVPEPPTTTQYLAAAHVEVETVMHELIVAEAIDQTPDGDDDFFAVAHFQPIQVKNTAKMESTTITRKIACTTAEVVRRPTSSALPRTCRPWKQPAMAMMRPKTGALMRPI